MTTSAGGGGQTTQLVRDTGGALLSARTGTQVAHAATNTHGDLIAWRATNNALVTSTLYDPFGQPTTAAGTGTGPGANLPLGYESHLTLPGSGLVDLGSRAYNPATGTFTSQDTVVGDLSQPVGLNRYTYAFASPLNYTDPSGYWPDFLDDAASAVSNAASNLASTVSSHAQSAAQTVASTVSSVASTVSSAVSSTASTVSSAASSAASTATRQLQGARAWASEHKATIASVAVGVGVGIGCTALTVGAGALGCAAVGGAAAGVVGNALDPNADHSFAGYAGAAGLGVGGSLAGYGAGRLLAPVAKRFTAPLFARTRAVGSRGTQGLRSLVTGVRTRARSNGSAAEVDNNVLLDSNVVTALRADPKLGGRIEPGERPVLSYVSLPELRNASSIPTAAYAECQARLTTYRRLARGRPSTQGSTFEVCCPIAQEGLEMALWVDKRSTTGYPSSRTIAT